MKRVYGRRDIHGRRAHDDPFRDTGIRMRAIAVQAHALYEEFLQDPGMEEDDAKKLSPPKWVHNQTIHRRDFEDWCKRFDTDTALAQIMLSDSNIFYKYSNFMYSSYPPGFGDAMQEADEKMLPFDGAAVFQHLSTR